MGEMSISCPLGQPTVTHVGLQVSSTGNGSLGTRERGLSVGLEGQLTGSTPVG
jgi:hypothetical protein